MPGECRWCQWIVCFAIFSSPTCRFELHPQGVAVVLIKPGAVKTAIWEDDADRHLKLLDSLTPEQMELYGKDLKLVLHPAVAALSGLLQQCALSVAAGIQPTALSAVYAG